MNTLKFLSASCAILALFGIGASAQIVQNGDFSTNGLAFTTYPGYSYSNADITDWTSSNTHNTGINTVTGHDSTYNAFSPSGTAAGSSAVDFFAFIQNTATLTQTGLTLTPGATYQLSFEYGQRFNFSGVQNPTTTAPAVGSITLSNGSLTFATVPVTGGVAGLDFTNVTASFVVPLTAVGTSSIILSQDDVSGTDLTLDFTNISITQVSPPAVPEPSTWILLAAGAAVLAGARRLQQV